MRLGVAQWLAERLAAHGLQAVDLQDIAFLEIIKPGQCDAELHLQAHLTYVLLEAPQAGDGAVVQ